MLFPETKYERTGRGITLIHQYKNNGYNIVLDVCSGAVHVLDDLCYDVLEVLLTEEPGKDYTAEELESAGVQALVQEKLTGRYPEEELSELPRRIWVTFPSNTSSGYASTVNVTL